MSFLAYIITWINVPINAAGKYLLAPVGLMPGWLSNTIIAAVTGVLLLILFKHTSNQQAIGRVKDDIKANMLTLKLFKDSIQVTLKAQGHLFKGALLLLCYAIVPLLIMIVPIAFLFGQMGLWYQARPLRVGEEALVTVKLNDDEMNTVFDTEKQNIQMVKSNGQELHLPKVAIESTDVAEVTTGPVRAFSKHEIFWKIKAQENGYHRIVFQVGDQQFEKELVVGDGFMRVSAQRPGWHWFDILLHPCEKPFSPDSLVQSISINYPERILRIFWIPTWIVDFLLIFGIPLWMIYFFIVSMVFALLFKPFLKVKI